MTRSERRKKAIIKRNLFLCVCALAMALLIFLSVFIIKSIAKPQSKDISSSESGVTASEKGGKQDKEPETDSRVTVLSTGDIMVHSTQLDGAYDKASGGYDFSAFFKEMAPYFKSADMSVANLEVTFGGTESGKFSGYPAFNTPDSLADVIKDSGLNFLVTANNHCYDTGLFGLKRTVQVLKEKNLDFIGTRESATDRKWCVKEINGIKIGMGNYTYEVSPENAIAGRKYINGSIIAEEANDLINTFNYSRIEEFYAEAESAIADMKKSGADVIVFYMHWGNEYKLAADTWQKTIAQKLSNLGVDIIIGSHPHVIEPVEYITSEGGNHSTVCIYSTGNCVSNQRQELMDSCPSGHTEDGMIFSYTLHKKGKTTVIEKVDIIPTWVNKYRGGSGYQYTVYPLESSDWGSSKYGLDSTAAAKAARSYDRTKAIVSEGLTAVQTAIGCEITFK